MDDDATVVEKSPEAEERRRDRITVRLTPRDRRRLEDLTEDRDLSANEAIRRALAVEHYLRTQIKEGRKVLIEQEDGTLRQVEFVS